MPTGQLLIDCRGRVAVFVVDRPEVRNALDPATLEALSDAVTAASADPDVGAAVLTGTGPACFSAGMDLRSVQAGGADVGAAVRRFHQTMRSRSVGVQERRAHPDRGEPPRCPGDAAAAGRVIPAVGEHGDADDDPEQQRGEVEGVHAGTYFRR
jgi:Enoyl-CoA hydratase/isomerase